MGSSNSNIDAIQFTVLSNRLAILLGFSDGVDDVLENLLTIESRADLLDYLVQLLGSDRHDQIRDFVDDVGHVRAGESLNDDTTVIPVVSTTAPASTNINNTITSKLEQLSFVPMKKSTKNPQQSSNNINNNNTSSSSKSVTSISTKPNATAIADKQQLTTVGNSRAVLKQSADRKIKKQPTTQPVRKSDKKEKAVEQQQQQPQHGTAKIVCGCFGTMHAALNNCLHCGRISCEREGYDYCAFCGHLVSEQRSVITANLDDDITSGRNPTDLNTEAWEQKERLLQYDREFAQRTVILDDQADYYNQSTSTWLSDTERQQASKQEQQRQTELQTRAKMKLQLS